MPDYQKMYLCSVRAMERAVRILIQAQQECEELYLSAEGPEILAFLKDDQDNGKKSEKY